MVCATFHFLKIIVLNYYGLQNRTNILDQGSFYTTVSAYIYNSLGIRAGKRDDPVEKKGFWDQVQFIEDHLLKDNQTFLTGNTMTIADISLGISMSMPMVYLGDKCYKKFPKITTWRGELMKVPEYAEGKRIKHFVGFTISKVLSRK